MNVFVVVICSCMLVSLLLGVICTGSSLGTQRAGSRKSSVLFPSLGIASKTMPKEDARFVCIGRQV